MNKKDRDRQDRAFDEGKQAFKDGKTLEDNPYKISTWGVGGIWKLGFLHARRSEAGGEMDKKRCPRCFGGMMEPVVRNALSRRDNKTYICRDCGTEEALVDYLGLENMPASVRKREEWFVALLSRRGADHV